MIKLSFLKPHKTVTSLSNTELPDFTVLTGKNGTGKSQLLNGIKEGDISVEAIGLSSIGLINQRDFSIQNGSPQNNMNLLSVLQNHYSTFDNTIKQQLIHNPQFKLTQAERKTIYETAERVAKPAYKLTPGDFDENDVAVSEKLTNFLNFANSRLDAQNLNTSQRNFYEVLLESTGKLHDDITSADVQGTRFVDDYYGGVLPQQLQFTILQYAKLWRTNQANNLLNKHHGHEHKTLTDAEFEAEHGGKPWELINNTLGAVEGFKYRLDFDEKKFQHESEQLAIEFIEKNNAQSPRIPVTELSSGEKTLVALVVSLYSAATDKKFPKLILLDEIDATLHPSMSSIFLELIQEQIVGKLGIKVILVTHSPSTVALAPDSAIYTMQTEVDDRLLKTTKSDALNQLTEGFVAITEEETATSLKFSFKGSPKDLVFFEGPSDEIYIRHSDNKGKCGLVNEFDITYAGSYSQLDMFWKLLSSSDSTSGYTHGMSATLVYDCDIKRKYESYAKHSRWSLDRIESNPIKDGIENYLRPEFVKRAKAENSDWFTDNPDGSIGINQYYKMNLASWFEENADSDDIAPFIHLINDIKVKAKHSS